MGLRKRTALSIAGSVANCKHDINEFRLCTRTLRETEAGPVFRVVCKAVPRSTSECFWTVYVVAMPVNGDWCMKSAIAKWADDHCQDSVDESGSSRLLFGRHSVFFSTLSPFRHHSRVFVRLRNQCGTGNSGGCRMTSHSHADVGMPALRV